MLRVTYLVLNIIWLTFYSILLCPMSEPIRCSKNLEAAFRSKSLGGTSNLPDGDSVWQQIFACSHPMQVSVYNPTSFSDPTKSVSKVPTFESLSFQDGKECIVSTKMLPSSRILDDRDDSSLSKYRNRSYVTNVRRNLANELLLA